MITWTRNTSSCFIETITLEYMRNQLAPVAVVFKSFRALLYLKAANYDSDTDNNVDTVCYILNLTAVVFVCK